MFRHDLQILLDIYGDMCLLDEAFEDPSGKFRARSFLDDASKSFSQHRPRSASQAGDAGGGLYPGALTCETLAQTCQYALLMRWPEIGKRVLLYRVDVLLTARVRPGVLETVVHVPALAEAEIAISVRALQNSSIVAAGTLLYR